VVDDTGMIGTTGSRLSASCADEVQVPSRPETSVARRPGCERDGAAVGATLYACSPP
jgi:hypothetical protein